MSVSNPSTISIKHLQRFKEEGRRIAVVTAYDATTAKLVDQAEVDAVLVGDSLGMVIQGHSSTLEVSLEHMIYHARCVSRGLSRAHLVVDLPFMSYQVSERQALRSAGRLVQEGGAHAVKLEGGASVAKSVERIVAAGIPVMGHLGLTPQSVRAFGGYRVQGRGQEAAERLLADARRLEAAGVYAIVLEGIPAELGAEVTAALTVPTIGIGAGPSCDGQVLVIDDLLGLEANFKPRFVKRYATLAETVTQAVSSYVDEVRKGVFSGEEHCYGQEPSQ